MQRLLQRLLTALLTLGRGLGHFPWRGTLRMLRVRFQEEQLGLTASSLTFTTLLALVPFFTVALSVFSAFPAFGRLQDGLHVWLVERLIPPQIATQVMDYLLEFSSKANQLGAISMVFLMITVISLVLTVDRTLNRIWRVQRLRPLGQRLLVYWGVLTFGPLLTAVSLAVSSYVMTASSGLVQTLPHSMQAGVNSLEFVLLSAAMAALFHLVPNTPVRWRHAWAGGLFVGVGMAVTKKLLGMYLAAVPTFSAIYGTFATLPILLVWVHACWVLFLLGAVIAAYLPGVLAGVMAAGGRDIHHPGSQCELALEIVATLVPLRGAAQRGLSAQQLSHILRIDRVELEPALDALLQLQWIGLLPASQDRGHDDVLLPSYALLADPQTTPAQPLLQRLLLVHSPATDALWHHARWDSALLADVLPDAALVRDARVAARMANADRT